MGHKITVDVGARDWPKENVMIKKGQLVSFSYSSTAAGASITDFSVGQQPETQGTVSFQQDITSTSIPENAIILLKDKNGQAVYQTTWQQVQSQGLSVKAGTYTVESYVQKEQRHIPIEVISTNPMTVNINKTTTVTLNYQQQEASLSIQLDHAQPSDADVSTVQLQLQNNDKPSDTQTVNIKWNSSADVSLQSNSHYKLSALDITGRQNTYHFTFLPSDTITTGGLNKSYHARIQVGSTPIQTYSVATTVTGLPQGKSIMLSMTKGGQVVKTQGIHNGSNTLHLPSGTYQATATTIIDGDYQYNLKPVEFVVNEQKGNSLNLNFDKEKASQQVKGWPSYIAMGAVTDANTTNTGQLKGRLVDAIFKYAGDGGNGDRGKLVYPIYTQNTYKLADELSKVNQHETRPVMVVYTAEMSGGTNFDDFDNQESSDEISNKILTKHFVNLMLLAKTMQTGYQKYGLDGSVILNPDLMGMVQQQKLYQHLLGDNPTRIEVTSSLKQAYWFVNTPHDWQLTLSNGKTLKVANKTPEAFIQMAENGGFKKQGVYSPWDIKVPWEKAATEVLSQYQLSDSSDIVLPSFTQNFKGWVSATNWVMKTSAPDITFGWQENVWNAGSATWVHANLSPAEIQNSISKSTVELWQKAGLYNGLYKPDFLVFDKYERNPIPGEVGSGYVWNARDWDNYLTYVKQMSQGLDNVPVMLWQIPGGHLQTTKEKTAIMHGATGPDYFLGNPDVNTNLSNLQPYIVNIDLNDSIYHCQSNNTCHLPAYLKYANGQSNYDWQLSNMDKARASNVFAILWGGGSTTSVGKFPMDDGGWLATQVNHYLDQQH